MVSVSVLTADWPTGTCPKLIIAGETVTMAGCPTSPTSETETAWVEVVIDAIEVKCPVDAVDMANETTVDAPGWRTVPA